MDSSHGNKRMNVEDDRLSSLPDELIHKILSSIGIKHVVQTSVLSSRWRFIWTSMPYLNFSREDFLSLSKPSELVTHVLSDRNDLTDVSSVKLCFDREDSDVFVKQIMTYAISHNIQQLNVECFLEKDVEFPICSRSLKHLTLTKENFSSPYCRRRSSSYVIRATSTWDLPSLTTLYLHSVTLCCDENTDECIGFFSKCVNLKNLTLKDCYTQGFQGLSICLPVLSNLTLENVFGSVKGFNIVAPQLKNLTIIDFILIDFQCQIFTPDLISLFYKGFCFFQLVTDDFCSLEKADISISHPGDAHQVLRLLQRLHNVKSLTLSMEIVELLSESVELMSNQASPFTKLKSLKIHPARELTEVQERQRVKMSAEVKSYLLDSSPGVNFSVVTREDIRAMNNTKLAQRLITGLRTLLEKEKARTETKMAKMQELGNTRFIEHTDSSYIYRYNDMCWNYMSRQIKKGKEKASDIISMLKEIKGILGELPASNLATIQPSFSTLCAEVGIFMSKVTDRIKMDCDENQRLLGVCFHELATTLEPSS